MAGATLLARRRLLGIGLAAGGCLISPRSGWAHAVIVESKPKSGETVSGRTLAARLKFNSRIDHKRSRLVLVGPDAKEQNIPIGDDAAPDTLSGQIPLKLSGAYRMRWQVLAIDGHITRGDIYFTVNVSAASNPSAVATVVT